MIEQLAGQLVCFGYEHRYRLVLVDRVWYSKEGKQLITGLDEDRNDVRTFRVDRIIRGKVRIVGQRRAGREKAAGVPSGRGAAQLRHRP